MSALTPERLAEIRERDAFTHERIDKSFQPLLISQTEHDRAVLLAEVDRLRAGIEALAEKWEHAVDDLNPLSSLGRALLMYGPDDLRALLNPTEGETDHE